MNIHIVSGNICNCTFSLHTFADNATIPIIQNYYAQCFSDLQHTLADVEQMYISFGCVSMPNSQYTGICHPHN